VWIEAMQRDGETLGSVHVSGRHVNSSGLAESRGLLRGWLENNGELTVKTPTAVDTLTALKIMSAFDRLAQDDGRSVMGCAFVSTKK
jgi:hypothetical protein